MLINRWVHDHTHTEREREKSHGHLYLKCCFLATPCVPVIPIEGKKMLTWIMHKAQRTLHYNCCLKSRRTISQPFHFQAHHFFHLLTARWWIKYGTEFSRMLICWMHMKFSSSALRGSNFNWDMKADSGSTIKYVKELYVIQTGQRA